VWANCYDDSDMTVPFGGYGQAGFGRDKSLHAMEKYAQLTTARIKPELGATFEFFDTSRSLYGWVDTAPNSDDVDPRADRDTIDVLGAVVAAGRPAAAR
jgi:hypothetical protein